jgi:hypothetical protein
MHQKAVLVLGLAVALAVPNWGQAANVEGGCECVEELSIPAYSPFAINSGTQGTAQIRITLDDSASIAAIEIRDVHEILKAPLRAAVKDWMFKTNCRGRTVHLTMQFRIRTEKSVTRQTVRFRPPCSFVVESPSGSLNATVHPPLPAASNALSRRSIK